MQEPVIVVKDLSKDYYQYKVIRKGKLLTHALKNVNFTVREGDFFGLLGQNGAGKSTLLRILTTNLKKTGGSVAIQGKSIDGNIREIKEQISWMFGVDYEGYGWSTIEKNLRLAAYYLGMDKQQAEQRVKELLEYFGLYKKRKLDVWRMSAGMQAKYSLAAAMLKQPKILFLDEPLLGLDVPAKEVLRNFLVQLNKEGTTIVYTDHQLQEMEKVCKNLVIIEKGEKVYDGSLERLKEKYRDTNVLELTCRSPTINRVLLQLKRTLPYVTDYVLVESDYGKHHVKVYTSIDSKAALLQVGKYLHRQGVVLESLNAGLLSLEDVYKKFLKQRPHHQPLHALQSFTKAREVPLQSHSKYLKHKHSAVRGAACSLLLPKKRKDVEKTLQRMSIMGKEMQLACLQVVGDARDKELLQRIKRRLKTRDKDVQLQLALAQGKIGEVRAVGKLLDYLLHAWSCGKALEELPKFAPDVLHLLGEEVRKLPRRDLQFLVYHIEKSSKKKVLFAALHITYKSYKDWQGRKKGQKMLVHGKVR